MDHKVDCAADAPHTMMAARDVVYAKNKAGGKWKAIHCQECSLWHVANIKEIKFEDKN